MDRLLEHSVELLSITNQPLPILISRLGILPQLPMFLGVSTYRVPLLIIRPIQALRAHFPFLSHFCPRQFVKAFSCPSVSIPFPPNITHWYLVECCGVANPTSELSVTLPNRYIPCRLPNDKARSNQLCPPGRSDYRHRKISSLILPRSPRFTP